MESQTSAILVKLIVSVNRRESVESGEENIDLAIKYAKLYPTVICGVDLGGDPSCKSFDDFESIFTKARHNGLKLALHCGEIENQAEINTMLKFGMNRLGHGTFVTGNIDWLIYKYIYHPDEIFENDFILVAY